MIFNVGDDGSLTAEVVGEGIVGEGVGVVVTGTSMHLQATNTSVVRILQFSGETYPSSPAVCNALQERVG